MLLKKPIYKRILLKLSGEMLLGERSFGVDPNVIAFLADEIKDILNLGVQIGIVMGGGNIFRGSEAEKSGMDRVMADYAGMLATIINGLVMEESLKKHDIPVRLMTAIAMQEIAEPYIQKRALRHLGKGRVVIFAGGTGNPFFTTDSGAALRASEIKADALLKAAKHVDGVYDKDPMKEQGAQKYDALTYIDALKNNLKVMDATAFALCMDQKIPIIVFELKKGNIKKVVLGEKVGTKVE